MRYIEMQSKIDLIDQTCVKLAEKVYAFTIITLEKHLIIEEGEGSIDLSKHDDIIYQYICIKKKQICIF